jgi:hypothetical protein
LIEVETEVVNVDVNVNIVADDRNNKKEDIAAAPSLHSYTKHVY